MKKFLLLCSVLLTLTACNNDETDKQSQDPTDNTTQGDQANESGDGETGSIIDADEENTSDVLPLMAYFMKDGTVAHFEGEGNEYATYTARTQYLDTNYIAVYENNGGTEMLRIYRVEEDQILLIWEESERYEDLQPSDLELESLEPMRVYLRAPLEQGAEFDGWVVSDTSETLKTPVKNFENVLIIEQKTDDGLNRRYFVEGYGEIKREFIMNDNGNETSVTSTLSKID